MIYKISNKGKTVVQIQLIGGEAINVQPGTSEFADGSKVFKRELDRLENRPGVHAVEYADSMKDAQAKLKKETELRNEQLQKANKDAATEAKKKAEEDAKKEAAQKKKDEEAAAEKAKVDEEARKKAEKEAKEKAERGGNR